MTTTGRVDAVRGDVVVDAVVDAVGEVRPRLVSDLAAHGERVALLDHAQSLTYAELAERVAEAVARLARLLDEGHAVTGGAERRLVGLAPTNSVDGVVAYLAARASGQVVLLADTGHLADLASRYGAAAPGRLVEGQWVLEGEPAGASDPAVWPELHPDLALLMSTSGSTGSAKLVRLSEHNLVSNAMAIATGLGLRPDDRAVTTLPLTYCFGLSVLHSHLAVGASLVLTEGSVLDPEFMSLCRAAQPTTLAGVPHTFELLERAGLVESGGLGTGLRLLTQAGGRMAPDRVARWTRVGERHGFGFAVMYGQTEATARMAILPPDLTASAPDAVGRAIDGGSLRIDAPDAEGVGDIVYSGPNVMMGYATEVADLVRGPEVTELRTGDRGAIGADGLLRITGRRARFAKILGLRIDLEEAARWLDAQGWPSVVVDLGDRIGVLALEGHLPARDGLSAALAARLRVPRGAVVSNEAVVPRLASGKPDLVGAVRVFEPAAVARGVAQGVAPGATEETTEETTEGTTDGTTDGTTEGAVAPLVADHLLADYRRLLDRPDAGPGDTFVGLGGDSLSYVEVSLRIEALLGQLPPNWHTTTITDLAQARAQRTADTAQPRWQRIETTVATRALAIMLVLLGHAQLATFPGGAHALMTVAGFNFARFHLSGTSPAGPSRAVLRAVLRFAVPSMCWIGAVALLVGPYAPTTALLVRQVFGDGTDDRQWSYWFVECLALILLALAALLLLPALREVQRRHPWAVAMSFVAVGVIAFAFGAEPAQEHNTRRFTVSVVFWLFAVGWSAAVATRSWQRLVTSVVLGAMVWAMWPGEQRHRLVTATLVLLVIWVPTIPVPRALSAPLGPIAAASLFIYLVNFQVFALAGTIWGDWTRSASLQWAGVAVSILAGIAYGQVSARAEAFVGAVRRRERLNQGSRERVTPEPGAS